MVNNDLTERPKSKSETKLEGLKAVQYMWLSILAEQVEKSNYNIDILWFEVVKLAQKTRESGMVNKVISFLDSDRSSKVDSLIVVSMKCDQEPFFLVIPWEDVVPQPHEMFCYIEGKLQKPIAVVYKRFRCRWVRVDGYSKDFLVRCLDHEEIIPKGLRWSSPTHDLNWGVQVIPIEENKLVYVIQFTSMEASIWARKTAGFSFYLDGFIKAKREFADYIPQVDYDPGSFSTTPYYHTWAMKVLELLDESKLPSSASQSGPFVATEEND